MFLLCASDSAGVVVSDIPLSNSERLITVDGMMIVCVDFKIRKSANYVNKLTLIITTLTKAQNNSNVRRISASDCASAIAGVLL